MTPSRYENEILEEGVIVRPIGTSLAICPPLVITDDEVGRNHRHHGQRPALTCSSGCETEPQPAPPKNVIFSVFRTEKNPR
ncbi:MAG: hypothetical protein Ct9H300mP12_06850 [Acidimicrobiales bacterium]|nr:MAG: hypothetical protein Ct9H300mP12_06850 [Acidimicrobiales bacterium]